jgi:hypothetical protein
MKTKRFAALALVCIASMPLAVQADDWDKKTIFTFNAPVEVPGKVLTPGSYVFKLLNTQADRHIVQVYDKDQRHLIGTFLTIPDYRMKPPDKPLITFEERAAGAPEAIKSWFYPGDNYGNEFVYPKNRAQELAKQSNQNVPSMPSQLSSNTTTAPQDQSSQKVTQMTQADLKAQKPSGDEVGVAEVFLIAVPATPPPPDPGPPARVLVALVHDEPALTMTAGSANRSSELPKAASPLPFLELTGLLLLVAGLLFRVSSLRTR